MLLFKIIDLCGMACITLVRLPAWAGWGGLPAFALMYSLRTPRESGRGFAVMIADCAPTAHCDGCTCSLDSRQIRRKI